MLQKSRRRPSASLVISLVALVIAASGTAVAASHLVGGDKLIKRNSLSGNRLRNHTLTGKQIKLSKLGKVPSAKSADSAKTATQATNALTAAAATNASHAASADTAASAGTAENGAKRIDFTPATGTDPAPAGGGAAPGAHTILSLDELTVTASCINAGANNVRVYVAFGAPTGILDWGGTQFNNPGTVAVDSGTIFGANLQALSVADLIGGNRGTTLEVIYRNDARTISTDLTVGADSLTPGCDVVGTAVAAPS
ncbi:MAG TPA: hypothetical protein VGG07_24125 [Solirubrobacteraceae bacterium]|jgi:hypothetical protein